MRGPAQTAPPLASRGDACYTRLPTRRWTIRTLALTLLAAALACAQQHDIIPADIEEGARNFGNFCAQCHGAEGNAMPGADLSRPTLRRATTDQQIASIMLSGIPGTAMPPNALNQRQVFTIVAFLHSLGTAPAAGPSNGDAARGRALFEGPGQCLTCHRAGGRGSYAGPDLTEIGLLRRAAALESSLLDPDAEILSQNATMAAVTAAGETIRGRVLNADTHSVELLDANGRMRSLNKDTLRSLTREPASAMPSYRDRFTPAELDDVVAYLSTLRGF